MTSKNVHLSIQCVLICVQFLVPAFVPGLTADQMTAIHATIGGIQAVLGYKQGQKQSAPEK